MIMYCPNCGQQIPDNSFFCPVCGSGMNAQAVSPDVNERKDAKGFAAKLRKHLSSTLFLVMCILLSCAVLLSFTVTGTIDASGNGVSTGYSFNFDIISILILIGMWITYVKAKSKESVISEGGFKLVSGSITAVWVIYWVCSVLVALSGIMLIAVGPMSAPYAGEIEEAFSHPEFLAVLDLYGEMGIDMAIVNQVIDFLKVNFSLVMTVLGIALVVFAVVMVILNIFYYGNLRKFARNLSVSYYSNKETNLKYKTVSVWLLVMGIFSAIGAFNSLMNFGFFGIGPVFHAAVLIVAYVWIRKLGEDDETVDSEDTVSYVEE